jgi:hypothetical protein
MLVLPVPVGPPLIDEVLQFLPRLGELDGDPGPLDVRQALERLPQRRLLLQSLVGLAP